MIYDSYLVKSSYNKITTKSIQWSKINSLSALDLFCLSNYKHILSHDVQSYVCIYFRDKRKPTHFLYKTMSII